MQQAQLTPEQQEACNKAINDFVSNAYGSGKLPFGTVILLPEFDMEDDKTPGGNWYATDTLVREATNAQIAGTGFIRLASMNLGDNFKVNYLKTNAFQPDTKLHQLLTAMSLGAGSVMPGKLIVEESTVPFSITNPNRDIKMAGNTGIECTFEGKPVYRRVKHTVNVAAVDTLVAHDNREEIRNAQVVAVKANSKGLSGAAKRAALKGN